MQENLIKIVTFFSVSRLGIKTRTDVCENKWVGPGPDVVSKNERGVHPVTRNGFSNKEEK